MKFIIAIFAIFFSLESFASVWHVGPARTYKYCSEVAPLVQHGDTVEINYASYINDKQVI
jgi:hypothetical protein